MFWSIEEWNKSYITVKCDKLNLNKTALANLNKNLKKIQYVFYVTQLNIKLDK